ncbi:hypothetical protein SteCoe_29895 [Stentor coeruleus]|uniref:Uncharacterized protein n=1 Tax=Stentor coeruleus TaxID=5963 RepID=A0A1R2B4U0_9CILI|nr:hypothetical protein SteCoe_29895 [Stentor coeruleus]
MLNREKGLHILRIAGSIFFFLFSVLVLIFAIEIAFLYLTIWGVIITTIYFILAVCLSRNQKLRLATEALFTGLWTINWTITIIYWCYIFPLITDNVYVTFLFHGLPLIFTIGEFCLNDFQILRKYYLIPAIIELLYFILNIITTEVTKSTIYPGINYVNAITYIILIVVLIIFASSLEIGRLLKIKVNRYWRNKTRENNSTFGEQLVFNNMDTSTVQ